MKKAPMLRASVLSIICVGAFHISHAQASGGVYAAPGMPVRVPGRIMPVSPTHARNRQSPKNEVEPQIIISPIFKRFWRLTQPDGGAAKAAYYRFQTRVIRYPVTSLRAGVGGKFFAMLTVLPSGKVGNVQIVRHVLDESVPSMEAPSSASLAAMETEFVQTVKQMSFEPSSVLSDTVTVTQTFKFQ